MSNNTIFYTQVGSVMVFVSCLFVLYRVLVQQKDATIALLKEKNDWLQDQVNALKETRPDALLDILERRLKLTVEELVRLNEDSERNVLSIREKEKEQESLVSEIEDLKARIDECPHCNAQLTTLAGDDVEIKVYACGYAIGPREHPCPYDPNFPTLDEYELRTKYYPDRKMWLCFPEPQTEMAEKLQLNTVKGDTEQQAIEGVRKIYASLSKNVPKPQPSSQ